jgi:hypothetical protein
VAGVRQDVAFDFRSCREELGGKSLARSAHSVSVGIDHDGGREPLKVVSPGECRPLGKSKPRACVVAVGSIEHSRSVGDTTTATDPPLDLRVPGKAGVEKAVRQHDTVQLQVRSEVHHAKGCGGGKTSASARTAEEHPVRRFLVLVLHHRQHVIRWQRESHPRSPPPRVQSPDKWKWGEAVIHGHDRKPSTGEGTRDGVSLGLVDTPHEEASPVQPHESRRWWSIATLTLRLVSPDRDAMVLRRDPGLCHRECRHPTDRSGL